MDFNMENSGIIETVFFPEETVNDVFLSLLQRFTDLYQEKGHRILVFLAAPPGAGKTTLAAVLQQLSAELPGVLPVTAVGMDGFHHYQSWLTSHTVVRNGESVPMVRIKGAPETFDLPALSEHVRLLKNSGTLLWPAYDRLKHDPVENAVSVTGDVILLEGNYLLLNRPGWRDLASYADLTLFIRADEDLLRQRLICRKRSTGVSAEEAVRFVDYSDMVNVKTCLEESQAADVTLEIRSGTLRFAGTDEK